MTENNSFHTEPKALYTINNPESVIEVFLDKSEDKVLEIKYLNNNRFKEYTYSIEEYLNRYSHHAAGKAVAAQLAVIIE
ncbi:MAG: hypothetical protein VXY91_01120 [Bacteroidota bacterium]|nr:hypothetical protein [Bacteroidota bacterium]